MIAMARKSFTRRIFLLLLCMSLACTLFVASKTVQGAAPLPVKAETEGTTEAEPAKPKPVGPVDEYDRGVPKTTFEGFIKSAGSGDFERAANYMDLRNLPRWMGNPNDGLPAYRDSLGRIETPDRTVDIMKGILDNHEGMNPDSPPGSFSRSSPQHPWP